jgi:hypothetical protein
VLAVLFGVSGAASAQTELFADKIRLGSAECVQQTGSGTPEASIMGKVCDTFIRTNGTTFATILYIKTSGTAGSPTNTGWVVAGGAWTHAGSYTYLDNIGDFVGIGTATPVTRLDIKEALNTLTTFTLSGDNSTPNTKLASIVNRRWNYDPTGIASEIGFWRVGAGQEGEISFATNPGAGTGNQPTERMRINQAGYVGIGTTTPDFNLQVNGTVAPETNYTGNLGSYLKKWLTIHAAELRVETLVATETMATIGGRINVAPTTQLTSDLAAAGGTISVKHNNLANGDRVRLEANGNVEWMAIMQAPQGSGPYTHNVTRSLDPSGANDWYAGDAVLNTGTTGDGYIDLYSDRSTRSAAHYGPTIVGNVRTGATYSDLEERWAIGNLNGVYGYSADIYGSAFGSPSASWIKVDPTNGLRLGNNTTTKVTIAPNGTATFIGDGGGVTNISGANIQTGTISANKITLSPGVQYLFEDPYILDQTAWFWEVNQPTYATVSDAPAGSKTIRGGATAEGGSARLYPVDTSKSYRVRFWARGVGEDGVLYATLRQYLYDQTPCAANGGRSPYMVPYVDVPSSWTEYSYLFQPGANGCGAGVPCWQTGVKYVRLDWLLNYGGTTGYVEIAYPRFEEMVPGELIVDGAITAAKIAANTITADRLTIGLGGNALGNSQFRLGLREPLGATGWAVGYGSDGPTPGDWTVGVGYSGRTLIGSGTAYMTMNGTPGTNTYRYMGLGAIPCLTGSTYEFSAYLGQINLTTVSLALYFVDSVGATVGTASSPTTTAPGSNYLDGYTRVAAIGVAPANTKFCFLYAVATTGATAYANPYLFITHAQFGERPTGTTVAAPWVAGGVTTIEGDQISTGAITATKMSVVGGWTWSADYFKKDTGTAATSSGMAPTDWPFYAGAQYANRATAPFRVSPAGAVTASSGIIGGFTLSATTLWTGSGTTSAGIYSAGTTRFFAGSSNVDAAPFMVKESGALTATNATLTGTVNATAGYFGDGATDVSIDSQGLSVGSSGRISAGGGSVTINSDGIELQSGSGNTNRYRFSDGSYLQSNAGYSVFKGSTTTALAQSSTEVQVSSSAFYSANGHDLGTSGSPWRDLYINRDVYLQNPPTTTNADYPIVWNSGSKALYYKTDGTTVNSCTTVNTESGIVTACSDPITPQIAALEARIAQLEAQMALLLEEARKR